MRCKTVACVACSRMRCGATAPRSPPRRACDDRSDRQIEFGGKAGLDEALHFLDGPPEDVARYVFILDAINFGSGWFGSCGRARTRSHSA